MIEIIRLCMVILSNTSSVKGALKPRRLSKQFATLAKEIRCHETSLILSWRRSLEGQESRLKGTIFYKSLQLLAMRTTSTSFKHPKEQSPQPSLLLKKNLLRWVYWSMRQRQSVCIPQVEPQRGKIPKLQQEYIILEPYKTLFILVQPSIKTTISVWRLDG